MPQQTQNLVAGLGNLTRHMMQLVNRHILHLTRGRSAGSVHRPQYRTIFSGIKKFLDEKLPNEASPEFSKPAMMVAPVLLTHGVLGSLLSYPVIAEALTREIGIVGSVSGDWDIIETSLPLSVGFMLSGLVSSFFGGTIAAMGPRKALLGSAVCIGTGLAVSAVGAYTHTLPLLYFGFGTSVGAGVGLCYASPIQTLMLWFPENKCMCGGVAASAIGLGAVLSRAGLERLLQMTATLPEYLGPTNAFEVLREGTSLSVERGGVGGGGVSEEGVQTVVSVVEVTVREGGLAAAQALPAVQEGLYLLGSGGATGAAGALAVMSALSFTALATSAALIRTPPREYTDDVQRDLFLSPLFSELTSREGKSVTGGGTDNANGDGSGDGGEVIGTEVSEEVDFFTAARYDSVT